MPKLFTTDRLTKSEKWTWGIFLTFSVTALIAAFTLSVEEIHLIKNPDAVLSCSFNLIVNCSTVMQSAQASVFFGVPNMLWGLMAFAVLVTVGVAALSGSRFSKGFLVTANVGVLLGALFSFWLFFQSVYVIGALCPWCLIVTLSCSMLLSSITHYNLSHNTFGFSKKTDKKVQNFLNKDFGKLLTASWLVLLTVLVFLRFGADLFA